MISSTDLTLADAADLLGVSVKTIRKLVDAGEKRGGIAAYDVTPYAKRRSYRITRSSLDAFRTPVQPRKTNETVALHRRRAPHKSKGQAPTPMVRLTDLKKQRA